MSEGGDDGFPGCAASPSAPTGAASAMSYVWVTLAGLLPLLALRWWHRRRHAR